MEVNDLNNEQEKRPSFCYKLTKTVLHAILTLYKCCVNLYGIYIFVIASRKENIILKQVWTLCYGYGTNWNFMFQTVFLSLSLLYDVLEWLDKHQTQFGMKLRYYRDVIFCGMVVPFTLFISTMFWTVYLIDRELVFPEVYDQVVPWWFNHCVHTNIAIVVLIETVLQSRRHPTNRRLELGLVTGVGVVYAVVYYAIYFLAGRWLYAVFGIMTWWQVCLYQLLIWGSTFAFYFLQFPINRIFHHEAEEDQKPGEIPGINKNGTRELQ